MYVVAFNGSPRAGGNTHRLLRRCLDRLEASGMETRLIQVGGTGLRGCVACGTCRRKNLERCALDDDGFNDWFGEMKRADAIVLGSPTYFWSVTPEMKALMDRAGYIARGSLRAGNGRCLFSGKVGAAVASYFRSGSVHTLQAMQALFLTTGMLVPGTVYWPQAQDMSNGADPRGVEKDAEGLRNVDELANTLIDLLPKVRG